MNLLLLEPFKTTFPSFRWIWRDNYTFLFEGEERDGIIGIGSEKNLQIYTTRSACCFSRDISDIFFFFFFKIKQFAEGVVRKPDSLQNPYELAASFHFLVLAVLSSPICRINTYVIEWIALRRSCVLLASIERRVSTHFFPPPLSSFSIRVGCSPVLNRNNNNRAQKWNVRMWRSPISIPIISPKTRRTKPLESSSEKSPDQQASQTSNRFHPRLDRLFLSTARVYLLANSYILIGRPLAGLSASCSPRLTQRNGRGQGITLDPEKERWRRDIFPVSNACHYYYRCYYYYYYYYYSMDREWAPLCGHST